MEKGVEYVPVNHAAEDNRLCELADEFKSRRPPENDFEMIAEQKTGFQPEMLTKYGFRLLRTANKIHVYARGLLCVTFDEVDGMYKFMNSGYDLFWGRIERVGFFEELLQSITN